MENGRRVTLTYNVVLIALDIIRKVSVVPLPAKAAYTLKRNADSLYSCVAQIQADGDAVLKKYGSFDKEKKEFIMDDESKQNFMKEYNETILTKATDVVIREIEVSQLSNAQLSVQELELLDFMIVDDHVILHPSGALLHS